MLTFSRRVIVALNMLNWAFGAVFLALIGLVLIRPDALSTGLAQFGTEPPIAPAAIVMVLLLATAGTIALHVVFKRLTAIIDTVAAGRPFILVNAKRLETIAWMLLLVQLLDLSMGIVAATTGNSPNDDLGWMPSIGGWLSVLLVFVVARVFRLGVIMQEENEATV